MGFYTRKATNLFRRGQCDATTDCLQTGGGAVSFAVDATVPARFSPQSIKVTTDGAAASQGVQCTSQASQASAAGVVGVGSIYFKGVGGQAYTARLRWANTDATVTDGAQTSFVATGDWQLVTPASLAVEAGKTGDSLRVIANINGTRAEEFHVAHPMLEKGQSAVAAYVPTSGGATATRNARNGSGHFYSPHLAR